MYSVRFGAGRRTLDESTWDPVQRQLAIAFELVREPPEAVLGLEAGVQLGMDTETRLVPSLGEADVTAASIEFSVGLHKTFLRDGLIQPHLGGGIAYTYAYYESVSTSGSLEDEDQSIGAYVHGGVLYRLGSRGGIGLDVRSLLATDMDLYGESGNADYLQVLAFVSLGF
jgi:hypothetical protein